MQGNDRNKKRITMANSMVPENTIVQQCLYTAAELEELYDRDMNDIEMTDFDGINGSADQGRSGGKRHRQDITGNSDEEEARIKQVCKKPRAQKDISVLPQSLMNPGHTSQQKFHVESSLDSNNIVTASTSGAFSTLGSTNFPMNPTPASMISRRPLHIFTEGNGATVDEEKYPGISSTWTSLFSNVDFNPPPRAPEDAAEHEQFSPTQTIRHQYPFEGQPVPRDNVMDYLLSGGTDNGCTIEGGNGDDEEGGGICELKGSDLLTKMAKEHRTQQNSYRARNATTRTVSRGSFQMKLCNCSESSGFVSSNDNCAVLLSNLPRHIRKYQLFDLIHTGQVACLHLLPPRNPSDLFATAKVVFTTHRGAENLIEQSHGLVGLAFGGQRIYAAYHNEGSRAWPKMSALAPTASRILSIRSWAPYMTSGSPNYEQNDRFWKSWFSQFCWPDIERTELGNGPNEPMIFRFCSIQQARLCMTAWKGLPSGNTTLWAIMSYEPDPCAFRW
ncbi:hypothetical protein B0O99DRAFT_592854 [Bisporella sp. PMI_857]|nr:hypothetical protein B0O99DRAFT_592854 [Bisporella sp. PMI_857]